MNTQEFDAVVAAEDARTEAAAWDVLSDDVQAHATAQGVKP